MVTQRNTAISKLTFFKIFIPSNKPTSILLLRLSPHFPSLVLHMESDSTLLDPLCPSLTSFVLSQRVHFLNRAKVCDGTNDGAVVR